jgi:hypothetical protein
MKRAPWILAIGLSLAPLSSARAEPPVNAGDTPAPLIDRVVVRWHAPDTGGPAHPQFVFERELAFEARLESLADPDPEPGPYHDRHVRAALERHIAETLLAARPITPRPDPKLIGQRAEAARAILEMRVHGRAKLLEAARLEGIGSEELDLMLQRQARASLYLDRMVAPMLEPSELDLLDLWRTGATPFKDQPFDQIKPALSRWYVGQRLAKETEADFQRARSRVVISVSRRSR